jgi:hypothetical protein
MPEIGDEKKRRVMDLLNLNEEFGCIESHPQGLCAVICSSPSFKHCLLDVNKAGEVLMGTNRAILLSVWSIVIARANRIFEEDERPAPYTSFYIDLLSPTEN